ncbi:MAG: hypothetical protein K6G03_10375 [Lachnospiraceae bacterium]|nr:hypothetical protein [Lachnospiraceae bacterium]
MNKMNRYFKKMILAAGFVAILGLSSGIYSSSCMAADTTTNNTTGSEQSDEDKYKLNDEVKEWLDAGNSIPGEVKYSTLASTSHLWAIDSNDISDGKVILSGNGGEERELYGLGLKDWLKTQFFYGDKLGQDDNRIKFKRPKKTKAF